MGAFFYAYRLLTAAFVALLTFVIVFHAWSKWIEAAPLDVPLTLSRPGRVEADVHIRLACPHRLGLYLTSKTRTRDEMRRLVGRYGTTEGIAVPLRWSFRDATGRVAASGEALNEGGDGHDAEGFYRSVSGGVPLPPGRYQLEVTLAGEVVGMEDILARMYFRCHPKSSAGWQTDALIIGGLAWLLAWPLMAGLTLLLAALAIREGPRAQAAAQSWDQSAQRKVH